MTVAPPETASFAGFARVLGVKRSYVTALKDQGRLVLTDDGSRVRVAESLQRVAETRDPSKAGVAARHAETRAGAATAPATAPMEPPAGEDADEAPASAETRGYQDWRTRRERALALAAERDNAIADGKLLVSDDVVSAAANAITTLRTRFESLSDVLGPQVAAESDEARCRALIAEAIDHALTEAARQFAAIGKQEVSE